MKKIMLLSLTAILSLSACKKEGPPKPAPVTPPAHPYFFKFAFDGKGYDLKADFPQYMPFYDNEAGGYQVGNSSLSPSAGLRLIWPWGYNVKESDLMGLVGKTLYFDDTTVRPEISFEEEFAEPTWYSEDTSDKQYFVKISSITYQKDDSILGEKVKVYVIAGTCKAILERDSVWKTFSEGAFNFRISKKEL